MFVSHVTSRVGWVYEFIIASMNTINPVLCGLSIIATIIAALISTRHFQVVQGSKGVSLSPVASQPLLLLVVVYISYLRRKRT